MFGETFYIPVICALLGGTAEVSHDFDLPSTGPVPETRSATVRADCLTETHVVEVGFADPSSARDSLQQAPFYAAITDRTPMIVLIDRDRDWSSVEYQIVTFARATGTEIRSYKEDFLLRLAMTAYLREMRNRVAEGTAGG